MANFQDKLNELVRGEKSAVETYNQILEKFKDDLKSTPLSEMKADHVNAVSSLESRLASEGVEPSSDSGPWGGVAKTVMGTAKIFGDQAALKALKEGEEHGKKLYNELLDCDDLPGDVASMVRDNLLPRQTRHINQIDQLMNQAS